MSANYLNKVAVGCVLIFLSPIAVCAEQVEEFWFVAEGTTAKTRKHVGNETKISVGHRLEPGSKIHIVQVPQYKLVATFIVPAGSKNARLLKRELRSAWQALGTWIKSDPQQRSLQVDLPRMPRQVRSLKQTSLPTRIVIVGTLLYDDPQQPLWKFGPKFPSDGCLQVEHFPFNGGVGKFSADTKVRWLITESDKQIVPLAFTKFERFYRLFFQQHNAELMSIAGNSATAFRFDLPGYSEKVEPKNDGVWMIDPTYRIVMGKTTVQQKEIVDPHAKQRREVIIEQPQPPLVEPEREKLPASSNKNISPPLAPATLVPTAPKKTPQKSDAKVPKTENVAFVRDCSWSLKWDILKETDVSWKNDLVVKDMSEKLRTLKFKKFSVIGFYGCPVDEKEMIDQYYYFRPHWWFYASWVDGTRENRNAACQEIANWKCKGGTTTLQGLQRAVEDLEGITTIYLYTDGTPSVTPATEVYQYVRKLAAQGITLHTIGVGTSGDDDADSTDENTMFLLNTANAGGGRYIELK